MDRLHHIAVTVPDIKQALAWYRGNFHVETVYEDPTWALLRFGNIDLALVLPGQHPPHIAIERPNAEAFGALTRHRDGTASVYVQDPFGNAIEIMKGGTATAPTDARF
jgi:catechol 2,3-dioxygenase-like lactoylglutathione lyase family enzyme